MAEASNSGTVFTQRQRIAELARQSPQMGFTSLNHLLDLPLLREAYHCTRKDGATGVDGQTASDYEKDMERNLQSLLDRAKSVAAWQAPGGLSNSAAYTTPGNSGCRNRPAIFSRKTP